MSIETSVYADRIYYHRRPGGREAVHAILLGQLQDMAHTENSEIVPETIRFTASLERGRGCVDNLLVKATADTIEKREE
jgi:hypothetical protein